MPIPKWVTLPEDDIRIAWKCPDCLTEYLVKPDEATIPYCSDETCTNYEDECDFERVVLRRKGEPV